jgi:hypothetical protein
MNDERVKRSHCHIRPRSVEDRDTQQSDAANQRAATGAREASGAAIAIAATKAATAASVTGVKAVEAATTAAKFSSRTRTLQTLREDSFSSDDSHSDSHIDDRRAAAARSFRAPSQVNNGLPTSPSHRSQQQQGWHSPTSHASSSPPQRAHSNAAALHSNYS